MGKLTVIRARTQEAPVTAAQLAGLADADLARLVDHALDLVFAANDGLTLNEDAAATITAAMLEYNDLSQPATAIVYTITSAATNGQLLLNGTPLALNDTFTQADINNGLLSYDHDGSETTSAAFGFDVTDGAGGTATGQSFAITVNPVNDAPVGTPPTSVVTDEDVPVAIAGLAISDAEMDPAVDEIRAKLVVQGGAGTLTIRTDVPGGVTAGQVIGNGSSAIFFFSGTTLDQINATFAATDGVTFTPASGVHGTFQILFGATDGGVSGIDPGGGPGEESFDLFFDVTINAANTAPTLVANAGETVDEGAATPISAVDLAFTDAEQPATAITYTITTAAAHGAVLLDGNPLALNDTFTQDAIDTGRLSYLHDGGETTSDSFGFSVSDGAGGTVTGQSFAITVNPVNDTPVNTVPVDFLVAGLEGQVIAVTGMQVSDADAGSSPTFVVNLFTDQGYLHVDPSVPGGASVLNNDDGFVSPVLVYGTLAEVNATLAALNGVTLHVDPEFSGSVTIGLTGSDGGATGADPGGAPGMEFDFDQFLVSVIPVNDAPVLDLDPVESGSDAAAAYAIGDLPVTLAPLAEFTDDNADFTGATLTVSLTANGSAGDQLRINNIGTGLGEIAVSENTISYEGVDVGTFTGGTDGTDLVITFNAAACHCAIQTVMENVNFQVTGLTPDTDQRTISFIFVDGGGTSNSGADTASADVTVDITAPPSIHITAPDAIAVGDETLVNTTTSGDQSGPSAALLSNGTYVIAWTGADGIYFQQYEADGTPFFGETKLVDASDSQVDPDVIALADGGFALVYVAATGPNPGNVFLQRFDSSGNEVGDAVQVGNGGDNRSPQAAVLTSGDIVVTWQSDAGNSDVQARLLDPTGAPITAEFTANSFTPDDQTRPDVAALADGGFRIVWTSAGQDSGGSIGVYGQDYDGHGTPAGAESHFNTSLLGAQQAAVVAGLPGFGNVVVWQDVGDIVQRVRNSATGSTSGELTVANALEAESNPVVTALDDGTYIISWVSAGTDGQAGGIYAQRFGQGFALSGINLINSTTAGNQTNPAVTALDDGYVISWTSVGQDGSSGGVYAQRYADAFHATEQVAMDLKGTIHVADLDTTGDVTVTLSVNYGTLAVDPGTSGVDVNPLFPDEVELTGTVAEIEALLNSDLSSTVTYTYDNDFPPPEDVLTVQIDDGNSTSTDTALIAIQAINDAPDVDLDFLEPGNDAALTWTEGDGPTLLAPYAIFDDDNLSFDGAVLTVAINGATSGEQLTIDDVGTGLGELGVSGTDVTYEGVVVGSFTGGTNGAPLVVTFNADACHCAVELTMASILYENVDDVTAAASRDIDFTLVDGGGVALGGADTGSASVALTLMPAAAIIAGAAAVGDEDLQIAITGVSLDGIATNPANPITVRLGVADGTLDIRTDVGGGIDASDVTGDGSGHLVIVATQDQINTTLAAAGGLTYQGDADFNGNDALTIDVTDASPATPADLTWFDTLDLGEPLGGLAMHDLDLDGTDDLVIGLEDGVLIIGSVLDAYPLNDPATPTSFAFADFDGDGFEDIGFAAANASDGYVGYVSSDTLDVVNLGVIGAVGEVVTGDFDDNGLADLAVTNRGTGGIAILLQDTPGHFLAPVSTPATTHVASALVTGDFNGDGRADLIVGNEGEQPGGAVPGSVQLLVGNGDGTFLPASPLFTIPANIGNIAVADFNGDGKADIVVASSGGGLNGVHVVLGNGDGRFGTPTHYAAGAGGAPTQVVAADLNGDGVSDLAVANADVPGTISILIGNGDGSFQAAVDVDVDDNPFALVTGDPDDDGDADLVAATIDGLLNLINNDVLSRTATGTKTIIVNPVDDPGVAQPDSFTITEAGSIVSGNLFAANGSGVDTDPDGTPVVSAVNGLAGNVGAPIILASGALLFVNADGTFGYNPNGRFLGTPAAGSGASNTPGHDSFTYTVAAGNTVTVTITLTGEDSNDTLLGTGGADVLIGGIGNDRYYIENALDRVVEASGQGTDIVLTSVSYTLSDPVSVEGLSTRDWSATTAINLTGNSLANTIVGNAGANILNGGGGADVMQGLGGNDRYYVDNVLDRVIEASGGGTDLLLSSVSYVLADGAFVEALATTNNAGTAAINLTGNSLANSMSGNAGANVLDGGGGADVMQGFGGDDRYYLDNALDRVLEVSGGGTDLVLTSVSYVLAESAFVEGLSTRDWTGTAAINLTGNSLDNHLTGNAGANILNGGGGVDVMQGFGGNDRYYIDNALDRVIEVAGGGTDLVLTSVSYALADSALVEALATTNAAGAAAINLTGNALDNAITGNAGANTLNGNGGNDSLVGLGGNDILQGGLGNDSLFGGLGADSLTGGTGADLFRFDSALGAGNIDTITDFTAVDDTILLDDAVFPGLPLGVLGAGAFVTGSAAADADDRIIYNNMTGALLFDADGSGVGAAVQFATLQTGLVLTAGDFAVI